MNIGKGLGGAEVGGGEKVRMGVINIHYTHKQNCQRTFD